MAVTTTCRPKHATLGPNFSWGRRTGSHKDCLGEEAKRSFLCIQTTQLYVTTLGLGWQGAEWWPCSAKWHSLRARQHWPPRKKPIAIGVIPTDR